MIIYKFNDSIIPHYEVHHNNKVLRVNGYIDKFMSIRNIFDIVVLSDASFVEYIEPVLGNNKHCTRKTKILEFGSVEDLIDLIPEELI